MLYLILHPFKRPAEKQVDLLRATLDLYGIEYTECNIDVVPDGATVITDCFLMETPCGDPGDIIASQIIDRAKGQNLKIIFYYPSESYSTLGSSFCPTAISVQKKNVTAYLIKNGDYEITGYTKNYNMPEFFAWIINSEFNRARLTHTYNKIDREPKTHKFLFLNGENRTNRQYLFELYRNAGLLEDSIWSNRRGKGNTGMAPITDWQDPFVHVDFCFYAYYPTHYYQTNISVVSETTQNEFFPTEKTYKSLMLGHPFALYGGYHSLKKLRAMGFETFNNSIDESYDNCEFPLERAEELVNSLNNCGTPKSSKHNRLIFQQVANSAYNNLLNILLDIDNRVIINDSFNIDSRILKKYFLN